MSWAGFWDSDTSFTFRRTLLASALHAGVVLPILNTWRTRRDWRYRAAAVSAWRTAQDTTGGKVAALLAARDPDGRVRASAYDALAGARHGPPGHDRSAVARRGRAGLRSLRSRGRARLHLQAHGARLRDPEFAPSRGMRTSSALSWSRHSTGRLAAPRSRPNAERSVSFSSAPRPHSPYTTSWSWPGGITITTRDFTRRPGLCRPGRRPARRRQRRARLLDSRRAQPHIVYPGRRRDGLVRPGHRWEPVLPDPVTTATSGRSLSRLRSRRLRKGRA